MRKFIILFFIAFLGSVAIAQPVPILTPPVGSGAQGAVVTYLPSMNRWAARSALQWWRLTPSYFRDDVRDSIFAVSADTAAFIAGIDTNGRVAPIVIGSGVTFAGGVLSVGLSGYVTFGDTAAVIATKSDFADGTYTPTLTDGANVDSSSVQDWQWLRVGNSVTVSGEFTVAALVTNTTTVINFDLPIPSNFTIAGQLGGAGSSKSTTSNHSVTIFGDAALNEGQASWQASGTADVNYSFSFTYRIL